MEVGHGRRDLVHLNVDGSRGMNFGPGCREVEGSSFFKKKQRTLYWTWVLALAGT